MATITPIRLAREIASGAALDPIDGWPPEVQISGADPTSYKTWFEGEITAQVIQIADGVLRFADTRFDEVNIILAGELTMTPDGGEPLELRAGDAYVIPRGYTGSFCPRNGYRAITVMDTAVLKSLMQEWNITTDGKT